MDQVLRHRVVNSGFVGAIIFVLTLGAATQGRAQAPITQSVDRAQLLRNQPPALRESSTAAATTDGEIAASPNDPDLGEQAILKRSGRYQPFSFFAVAAGSYTSNVALASSNEQDDFLFTPSFGLNYAPRLTRNLFADIGVAQRFFYYDRFSELDFGSFDARGGLSYSLPQLHDLILRADYAFDRLTSDDGLDDEFFSSHSLIFDAEIPFRLDRAQQLSFGVDLNLLLAANPEGPGRNDYSFFAAYSVTPARSFSLTAVARLVARDYTEIDRTDVSGIFALSAAYRITKWLSASASANYATNDSNEDVFDYDVFNVGAALSLNLRF